MSGTIEVNRIQEFIKNELRNSDDNFERASLENLTSNISNKGIRRATLAGRDHIVAPVSMIVPGVLNGSKGPLFYPAEEVAKNPSVWNGIPLVVYHPTINGNPVSARTPEVLDTAAVGQILKATINSQGKLVAEAWFDIEACKRVDNRVLTSLLSGKQIELSTGLFTTNVPAPYNATYNGRPYTYIAKDYVPDHLAILPDQVGACSIKDGCGVLVNRELTTNGWVTLESGQRVFIGDNGEVLPSGPDSKESKSPTKESGMQTEPTLKPIDSNWLKMPAYGKTVVFHEGENKGYTVDLHGVIPRRYEKEEITWRGQIRGIKGGAGEVIVTHPTLVKQAKLLVEPPTTNSVIEEVLNGGPGSGNFGHSGRPGEIGGSSSGEGIESRNEVRVDSEDDLRQFVNHLDSRNLRGEFGRSTQAYTGLKLSIHAFKESTLAAENNRTSVHSSALRLHLQAKKELGTAERWLKKLGETQDKPRENIKLLIKEHNRMIGYHQQKSSVQNTEAIISEVLNGGQGSGNFGHSVRPGERGGSSSMFEDTHKTLAEKYKSSVTNTQAFLIAESVLNGGQGSGNFGHAGRPGERGGSSPASDYRSAASAASKASKLAKKSGSSQDHKLAAEAHEKAASKNLFAAGSLSGLHQLKARDAIVVKYQGHKDKAVLHREISRHLMKMGK